MKLVALGTPSPLAQFTAIIRVKEIKGAIGFKMVAIGSYFPLPNEVLRTFVACGRVTRPMRT